MNKRISFLMIGIFMLVISGCAGYSSYEGYYGYPDSYDSYYGYPYGYYYGDPGHEFREHHGEGFEHHKFGEHRGEPFEHHGGHEGGHHH